MVRTSRSTSGTTAAAAAAAALPAGNMDDIDLDVMFAEDGDALFDDLDMDLDMDDIGGGGGGSHQSHTTTSNSNTTSSHRYANTNRGVLSRPPPSSSSTSKPIGRNNVVDDDDDDDDFNSSNTRTRRKTKRKAKTPSFFEDDDDDDDYNETIPSNKNKKRKAGSNSTTAPSSKANTASNAASVAAAMSKKKSNSSSSTSSSTTAKGTIYKQQQQTESSSNSTGTVMKSTSGASKSKSKSSKSSTTASGMPPPLARSGPWNATTSTSSTSSSLSNNNSHNNNNSNVASVGQFGNRHKRPSGTAFPSLPKSAISVSTSSSSTSNQSSGRVINKLPLARSMSDTNMNKNKSSSGTQQQQQQKLSRIEIPSEDTYCGLQPSAKHFYPFMPTLPLEPALKSRKVYGTVDRMHTSLVGFIHTPPTTSSGKILAKENDPIFQLLQEAFKEEKAMTSTVRVDSIGIAIAELRHSISTMDKNKIISDWYKVCALVQRQHDFLKQNCDNMERWCRDNFSKEDFNEAFVPPTKKRKDTDNTAIISVLKTFKRREIKVRISFTGMKDPKAPVFIPAIFPPLFLPNEIASTIDKEVKATTNTKKKSQTTSDAAAAPDSKGTDLTSPSTKLKPPQQQPLSYINMKPPRRRRNVAEMIARTARELSKSYTIRNESSRRNIDRKEAELQKVAIQDTVNGIHTAGMWKYIELSGHFTEITESEILERLGELHSFRVSDDDKHRMKRSIREQSQAMLSLRGGVNDDTTTDDTTTVYDRLQSLLIDVGSGDDDDDDCDEEYFADVHSSTIDVLNVNKFIDVSQLTLEERSFVQLHDLGLTKNTMISDASSVGLNDSLFITSLNGHNNQLLQQNRSKENNKAQQESGVTDLDDVISAMKSELEQVENLNDARISFLETISQLSRPSKKDEQQRNEREASLIAKCQQLIRKSKDLKAKSSAATRKDDSLALPW